jgi:hypothetical protein
MPVNSKKQGQGQTGKKGDTAKVKAGKAVKESTKADKNEKAVAHKK